MVAYLDRAAATLREQDYPVRSLTAPIDITLTQILVDLSDLAVVVRRIIG